MLQRLSVLALVGLAVLAATGSSDAAAVSRPRVIVLGFDGVDDTMTRRYMEEGHLPNLSRLAKMGSYRPLVVTNPAQSPVSWAAFATGTNPGKTGIFDFLKRPPGTYDAQLGLARKTMSRAYTPQAGMRWVLRAAPAAIVAVLVLLVSWIVGRRKPAWFPIGLAAGLLLGIGTGFLFQNVHLPLPALEKFTPIRDIPDELPTPVNLRQGKTFWQTLGEAGVRCTVVEAPTSFPADETENGRVLSGLGVPDIAGTFGLYCVITNDPTVPDRTEMGAIIRHAEPDESGVVRTWVRGPENFLLPAARQSELRSRIRVLKDKLDLAMAGGRTAIQKRLVDRERDLYAAIPIEIRLMPGAEPRAALRVQGQEQTVALVRWSDYFTFEFELNEILKPSGIARFHLKRCDEKTYTVLLSQINWNPRRVPPNVPITSPPEWAAELSDDEALGYFDTLGWSCITSGLKDEMMGEAAFLAHTHMLWDARRRKTKHLLAKDDWDCFVAVLTETDRIQHMMWRLIDEKSPRYDAKLAEKFGDSILEIYQKMDALVGEVMDEYLVGNTVLFVCSDHGFQSFRRGVNLNTWLLRNGWMKLKGQGENLSLEDLFDPDMKMFQNVDWSGTKAYSMGLGKIYINLKGREPGGIVEPSDYAKVCSEIRDGLLKLKDDDGSDVVKAVYLRDEIYAGAQTENAEDLIIGFHAGYRVGWQTTLGGAPPAVIEDNKQKWSGDHCSFDPSIVRGVCFSSRPISAEPPSILDFGPTVLSLFGVDKDPAMDGEVILAPER
jgi:predicted AlkP superfamily phosphohydrolase/phosphomutase